MIVSVHPRHAGTFAGTLIFRTESFGRLGLNMSLKKVLILGIEQSGYSRGLLRGFNKNGFDSHFIEIAPEWPESANNEAPENGITKIYHPIASNSLIQNINGKLRWYLKRIIALRAIDFSGAIVIVNSGVSLLPMNLDLLLARYRGATIVTLCGHGTDSRSPIVSRHQKSGDSLGFSLIISVFMQAIRLRYWSKLSHYFFCSPMTGALVPTKFYNQLDLGHPLNLDLYFENKSEIKTLGKELSVVHSASSNKTKGSELIQIEVDLAGSQVPVKYEAHHKLAHDQFLKVLRAADLVIDQAYSDYPLPVAAAEAMALGKLVLVSGYFAPFTFPYSNFNPPVFTCLPKDISKTVVQISKYNRVQREKISVEGRKFIEKNFNDHAVASRLIKLIAGENDSEITITSASAYNCGAGIDNSLIKKRISKPLVQLLHRFCRLY